MPELLLVIVGLLVIVSSLEGVAIFALFRQVGLLYLTLERGTANHIHRPEPEPIQPFGSGSSVPTLQGTTVQGQNLDLENLSGSSVLLAFVHPVCTPCNDIAPEFQTLHEDEGLRISVVVMSDGDRASTEEYVAEHHLSVPVLYEPRGDFSQPAAILGAFKVPRTPFAYLLDKQHCVISSNTVGSKEDFWRVARGAMPAGTMAEPVNDVPAAELISV